MALSPIAEACVDVNAQNTKAGSLKCRPMEPHVEQPHLLPPYVAPIRPMSHNTSHMQHNA